MAGSSRASSLNILRTLYRELRPSVNSPQKHVYETQLWKHIIGLCRNCKTYPPSKVPEVLRNLESTGRSYVFYLQGLKEYHRISEEYKGVGERTADDTAKIMGFKMPNEPKDSPRLNSNSHITQSSSPGISSSNVNMKSSNLSDSSLRTELSS